MKKIFTSLFAVALLFGALTTKAQLCNASYTTGLGPAGTATFISTSTGTSNPTTYTFYFGDGSTGAGPNTSHSYSVNGTYYTFLLISSGSVSPCMDSASTAIVITNTTPVMIT